MVESKAWNWEMISSNSEEWNTPSEDAHFLSDNWKEKGFSTILDVGCGFGRNAIYFAKNGFEVSAFDLSEKAVEMTISKAKENNINLREVKVADMLNFPFADSSFDCVFAYHSISHTDTKGFEKILSEIMRVLKVGGEAYFTLCSKDSFWFNNPVCIPVDENTKIRVEDGPENGIPHFYVNDKDCENIFQKYKIISIKNVRTLTKYGNYSSHYHIWIKK